MRRNIASLLLIPLIAGAVPALSAQGRDRGLVELAPPPARGGMYFSAALGAGSEQCKYETVSCGVNDANGNVLPSTGNSWRQATTAPSFALRFGGTPSPSVRLGGELFGWSAPNGPATERTIGLLLDAQFYPAVRSGFYLKGGGGMGWSSYLFPGYATATDNGFIFNVGAGYDFPVSRNVQITPLVDFYQGSYPGGVGQETLSERIVFFGASLTLQSRRWR